MTLGAKELLRQSAPCRQCVYLSFRINEGNTTMAKSSSSNPSKTALSKAGKTLASNSSSKPAKSKAGSTRGKG